MMNKIIMYAAVVIAFGLVAAIVFRADWNQLFVIQGGG